MTFASSVAGSAQGGTRDAFWVAPRDRAGLQDQRVALVDDVLTTGATAHAAALALVRAGAASVEVWVARTPLGDP